MEAEPRVDVQRMDDMIEPYGGESSALIAVLQDIQAEHKYLPQGALRLVGKKLSVPLSRIYHVATFYAAFSLEPKGEHLISVCLGTACHVRGAPRIRDTIERELDIKSGETTPDRLFSLESVNCLGACALGPIVVIDSKYHGNMTLEKVVKLLKSHRESAKEQAS